MAKRSDIIMFWYTFAFCIQGAYLGSKYGFPQLENRADAAIFGILIGALLALLVYTVILVIISLPKASRTSLFRTAKEANNAQDTHAR